MLLGRLTWTSTAVPRASVAEIRRLPPRHPAELTARPSRHGPGGLPTQPLWCTGAARSPTGSSTSAPTAWRTASSNSARAPADGWGCGCRSPSTSWWRCSPCSRRVRRTCRSKRASPPPGWRAWPPRTTSAWRSPRPGRTRTSSPPAYGSSIRTSQPSRPVRRNRLPCPAAPAAVTGRRERGSSVGRTVSRRHPPLRAQLVSPFLLLGRRRLPGARVFLPLPPRAVGVSAHQHAGCDAGRGAVGVDQIAEHATVPRPVEECIGVAGPGRHYHRCLRPRAGRQPSPRPEPGRSAVRPCSARRVRRRTPV